MASTRTPTNFEMVMAVSVASVLVHHVYMPARVMSARKKYGIKYPNLYASKECCDKEEHIAAFNSVQRGHQNSLEQQPALLTMLMLAGVNHPITASVAGLVALVGRLVYFEGYSSAGPAGRFRGSFWYLGYFTLLGTVTKTVASWALGKQ